MHTQPAWYCTGPGPLPGSAAPRAQPRRAHSTELGGRDTRALALSPALSRQCHRRAQAGSRAGSEQGRGDRAVPAPQRFQPSEDTVLSAAPAALHQPPCIPRDSCCGGAGDRCLTPGWHPSPCAAAPRIPRGHGARCGIVQGKTCHCQCLKATDVSGFGAQKSVPGIQSQPAPKPGAQKSSLTPAPVK